MAELTLSESGLRAEIASIRRQFDSQLLDGSNPAIETILKSFSQTCQDPQQIELLLQELILTEVAYALSQGSQPQREHYLQRFPEHAEAIVRAFDCLEREPDVARRIERTHDGAIDLRTVHYVPTQIGDYDVLEELGRGGMGVVYKARHRMLQRLVAIKVMDQAHLSKTGRERFLKEIIVSGRVQHPNIVAALDAREFENQTVLVMEYIEGEDLASLIRRGGPLGVAEALQYVHDACLGLIHAHEKGIVHRDVKPGNLLREDSTQRVKLLDLGLASIEGALDPSVALPETDHHSEELTRTGDVIGTVLFMSPEQAADPKEADVRSDIYSLGCTLYYLIVGKPPYRYPTAHQTLDGHRRDPIPNASEVVEGVPRAVSALLTDLMAKSPDDRPDSMRTVATRIENLLQSEYRITTAASAAQGIRSRTSGLVIGVVLTVAAVAGAALLNRSSTTDTSRPHQREQALSLQLVDAATSPREVHRILDFLGGGASIAFGAHPPLLAYSSADSMVHLVDADSFDEQQVFAQHRGTVTAVAFADQRRLMASASGNRRVYLWDIDTAEVIYELKGQTETITELVFFDDDRRLVGGSHDQNIYVWSVESGEKLATLRGHSGRVKSVDISPDQRWLVSAGADPAVRIWDLKKLAPVRELFDHTNDVWAVEFSPDGRLLASCGLDGNVHIWSAEDWQLQHEFAAPDVAHDLCFLDHERLLLACQDGGVRMIDPQRGAILWQNPAHAPERARVVAVGRDGRFASGGLDQTARVFRPASGDGR